VKKDEATQVRIMVNRFVRGVNRLFGGEATQVRMIVIVIVTTMIVIVPTQVRMIVIVLLTMTNMLCYEVRERRGGEGFYICIVVYACVL